MEINGVGQRKLESVSENHLYSGDQGFSSRKVKKKKKSHTIGYLMIFIKKEEVLEE